LEVVEGKYICPVCGNVMKDDTESMFFNLRCENCNFGTTKEAVWMCDLMCPNNNEEE